MPVRRKSTDPSSLSKPNRSGATSLCPVCGGRQSDSRLNQHLDICLGAAGRKSALRNPELDEPAAEVEATEHEEPVSESIPTDPPGTMNATPVPRKLSKYTSRRRSSSTREMDTETVEASKISSRRSSRASSVSSDGKNGLQKILKVKLVDVQSLKSTSKSDRRKNDIDSHSDVRHSKRSRSSSKCEKEDLLKSDLNLPVKEKSKTAREKKKSEKVLDQSEVETESRLSKTKAKPDGNVVKETRSKKSLGVEELIKKQEVTVEKEEDNGERLVESRNSDGGNKRTNQMEGVEKDLQVVITNKEDGRTVITKPKDGGDHKTSEDVHVESGRSRRSIRPHTDDGFVYPPPTKNKPQTSGADKSEDRKGKADRKSDEKKLKNVEKESGGHKNEEGKHKKDKTDRSNRKNTETAGNKQKNDEANASKNQEEEAESKRYKKDKIEGRKLQQNEKANRKHKNDDSKSKTDNAKVKNDKTNESKSKQNLKANRKHEKDEKDGSEEQSGPAKPRSHKSNDSEVLETDNSPHKTDESKRSNDQMDKRKHKKAKVKKSEADSSVMSSETVIDKKLTTGATKKARKSAHEVLLELVSSPDKETDSSAQDLMVSKKNQSLVETGDKPVSGTRKRRSEKVVEKHSEEKVEDTTVEVDVSPAKRRRSHRPVKTPVLDGFYYTQTTPTKLPEATPAGCHDDHDHDDLVKTTILVKEHEGSKKKKVSENRRQLEPVPKSSDKETELEAGNDFSLGEAEKDYSKRHANDIRHLCAVLKLDATGTKLDLIERLRKYDADCLEKSLKRSKQRKSAADLVKSLGKLDEENILKENAEQKKVDTAVEVEVSAAKRRRSHRPVKTPVLDGFYYTQTTPTKVPEVLEGSKTKQTSENRYQKEPVPKSLAKDTDLVPRNDSSLGESEKVREDYSKQHANQLRHLCAVLKLNATGSKLDLIDRLQKYDAACEKESMKPSEQLGETDLVESLQRFDEENVLDENSRQKRMDATVEVVVSGANRRRSHRPVKTPILDGFYYTQTTPTKLSEAPPVISTVSTGDNNNDSVKRTILVKDNADLTPRNDSSVKEVDKVPVDYSKRHANELRHLCAVLKLNATGSKLDLIDRLLKHDSDSQQKSMKPSKQREVEPDIVKSLGKLDQENIIQRGRRSKRRSEQLNSGADCTTTEQSQGGYVMDSKKTNDSDDSRIRRRKSMEEDRISTEGQSVTLTTEGETSDKNNSKARLKTNDLAPVDSSAKRRGRVSLLPTIKESESDVLLPLKRRRRTVIGNEVNEAQSDSLASSDLQKDTLNEPSKEARLISLKSSIVGGNGKPLVEKELVVQEDSSDVIGSLAKETRRKSLRIPAGKAENLKENDQLPSKEVKPEQVKNKDSSPIDQKNYVDKVMETPIEDDGEESKGDDDNGPRRRSRRMSKESEEQAIKSPERNRGNKASDTRRLCVAVSPVDGRRKRSSERDRLKSKENPKSESSVEKDNDSMEKNEGVKTTTSRRRTLLSPVMSPPKGIRNTTPETVPKDVDIGDDDESKVATHSESRKSKRLQTVGKSDENDLSKSVAAEKREAVEETIPDKPNDDPIPAVQTRKEKPNVKHDDKESRKMAYKRRLEMHRSWRQSDGSSPRQLPRKSGSDQDENTDPVLRVRDSNLDETEAYQRAVKALHAWKYSDVKLSFHEAMAIYEQLKMSCPGGLFPERIKEYLSYNVADDQEAPSGGSLLLARKKAYKKVKSSSDGRSRSKSITTTSPTKKFLYVSNMKELEGRAVRRNNESMRQNKRQIFKETEPAKPKPVMVSSARPKRVIKPTVAAAKVVTTKYRFRKLNKERTGQKDLQKSEPRKPHKKVIIKPLKRAKPIKIIKPRRHKNDKYILKKSELMAKQKKSEDPITSFVSTGEEYFTEDETTDSDVTDDQASETIGNMDLSVSDIFATPSHWSELDYSSHLMENVVSDTGNDVYLAPISGDAGVVVQEEVVTEGVFPAPDVIMDMPNLDLTETPHMTVDEILRESMVQASDGSTVVCRLTPDGSVVTSGPESDVTSVDMTSSNAVIGYVEGSGSEGEEDDDLVAQITEKIEQFGTDQGADDSLNHDKIFPALSANQQDKVKVCEPEVLRSSVDDANTMVSPIIDRVVSDPVRNESHNRISSVGARRRILD